MAVTRDDESTNITRSGGRAVSKKLDLLDKKMDGLYKDIYVSRPDNRQNLDSMIDDLDNIIDKLQGSDSSVSGMTELLRRVDGVGESNTKKFMSSVQDLFNDQNVVGSLFMNDDVHKYIAGQNYNYDLICKYLPRLQDALEIKRDNVLSSDNFSKSFINPKSVKSSKEEAVKFSNNTKRIEEEYDISEFLDQTYMNTSKYGEDFIYIVPYKHAFERLFKKEKYRLNSSRVGQVTLFEGYQAKTIITESSKQKEFFDFANSIKDEILDEAGDPIGDEVIKNLPKLGSLTLHFNNSNIISSAISESCVIRDKADMDIFTSVCESYFGDTAVSERSELNSMFSEVEKQNRKLTKSSKSSEGLILMNGMADRDASKLDNDFLGAVVERIPRENMIPIYIGKKCLGYYYLEFAEDPNACGFCGGHHTTPMLGNGSKTAYDANRNHQELAIRYISSKISQAIDTKFINANKDLKEEIYAILNYNDKFDIARSNNIGVSFIPAEDVVHCYFKLNETTHRGVSDLSRAVVPAMLYILLYLTDIIGKITRSTDKRVYYVKQNVETNVARTMMNVVQQIKKGNMGMRQIESMNNILNIVGKYNDYIIPMGPSGEPPIQFEVMQGQDIQTPTDIMEKMEESAINTIMPMEFVNSTYQQDFATRFTMSNTRFLKTIYTRQRKTERFFSKIYTKIYNYEFGEKIKKIDIVLPPPTYLVMTNSSQLIDNINQMADKIAEVELSTEEDDVKLEFKKLYLQENLGTYIDFDMVAKLADQAKVNVETNKDVPTADGDESSLMDDDL